MATWTGKPKVFNMEVCLPNNHGYLEWKPVECGWEYGTVSDYFKCYTQIPGLEKEWCDLLSNEGAEAMLWCLADWYNCYEGKEKLDKMIAEIREGRE